jgi:arylformamidase
MTVHAGTHADAPFHVDAAAATIDRLDLSTFLGPAVVLDVAGVSRIEPQQLHDRAARLGLSLADLLRDAPRLLLRTGSWPDRARFPERYATLSESAAELIVDLGARLLGVDVPSVDAFGNAALPIHHALIGQRRRGAGVQILENLVLDGIAPGTYELIALPLKISGADGSPVRAVLVER